MKAKRHLIEIYLLGALLFAFSAQAQFLWSERVASTTTLPGFEVEIGLALDTNDNCYVSGWFDDTNDFGGVTLTNQSGNGGSDIFVAKYNSAGALQWAQRAGGTAGNQNTGNGIGIDANGNVYVTGSVYGSASFGNINLPASGTKGIFLAKYDNTGAIQWVQYSFGVNDDLEGTGLAVDGSGNCYALAYVGSGNSGATLTIGSVNVLIPNNESGCMLLIKYDNAGTVQWVQLLGTSGEVWSTKDAVDAAGNVYVRGIFEQNMTIGNSNLVVSPATATQNGFVAKFNSSGSLIWVQQLGGGDVSEGGVAVDPGGNVFINGQFTTNLNFGGGIILTNLAPFGDAFVAKYNSSGVIQWAQSAGGTNGGLYWAIALDGQTNVYPAGVLGSQAAVAKYSSSGTLQWAYSGNNLPASPVGSLVAQCAVDSSGHCYLDGWYQVSTTFGGSTLQPQEAWNFFLADVNTQTQVILSTPQVAVTKSNLTFQLSGPAGTNYVLQVSTNLMDWNSISTSSIPISGSITLTNAIGGYNRGFYRVYLQ
jgi:Beta-propeller repeat